MLLQELVDLWVLSLFEHVSDRGERLRDGSSEEIRLVLVAALFLASSPTILWSVLRHFYSKSMRLRYFKVDLVDQGSSLIYGKLSFPVYKLKLVK